MNILVTAIGSFSADCVIKTLRKNGHFVAGCDIYPPEWHAASRECNVVYQAPLATNEKEYIAFLLDICKRHGIQRLFPLTDLEIDVLNKRRKAFNGTGGGKHTSLHSIGGVPLNSAQQIQDVLPL